MHGSWPSISGCEAARAAAAVADAAAAAAREMSAAGCWSPPLADQLLSAWFEKTEPLASAVGHESCLLDSTAPMCWNAAARVDAAAAAGAAAHGTRVDTRAAAARSQSTSHSTAAAADDDVAAVVDATCVLSWNVREELSAVRLREGVAAGCGGGGCGCFSPRATHSLSPLSPLACDCQPAERHCKREHTRRQSHAEAPTATHINGHQLAVRSHAASAPSAGAVSSSAPAAALRRCCASSCAARPPALGELGRQQRGHEQWKRDGKWTDRICAHQFLCTIRPPAAAAAAAP